ncbi:MAG TPA: universal stress protein [Rhizomicrobium sp.]|nr:universal stress protein [Rhizomicrobium sp.]
MYKNILLAYDGSMEGVLALREGALLAKTCGAKVVLLSVVPNPSAAAEMAEGLGGALAEQIEEYKRLLKQAVAWLKERGFEATPKLIIGDPTQIIGAVAKEMRADLVVVGHQRKSAFSRWWSGSKQAYLSDHVGCSILIACNSTGADAFDVQAGSDAMA